MEHPPKIAKSTLYLFAFLIIYFLFEACWVSFWSLGAGLDDAELISNTSFWNWGYGGSQPPLYTWIGYGITHLFGLHFTLLQILRFSILASTFIAVYLGLRLLRVSPIISGFACLSVFLIPQISWESQRALIHSVLGTAGSAWSFAAFVWFVNQPSFKRSIALGFAIAIAILGKYNGLIFVLALFMSAILLPQVRQAVKSRFSITALFAAFVFMSPALIYMISNPSGLLDRASKFNAENDSNWFVERLTGLTDLFSAGLNFVAVILALSVIIGIIVWNRHRKAGNARANYNKKSLKRSEGTRLRQESVYIDSLVLENAIRFLGVILLCGIILCVVMVILSGATNIKDRWLQPVLFLAAPFATLLLAKYDSSLRAPRALAVFGGLAAFLIPIFLYGNLYLRTDKNDLPVQNLDYPALTTKLEANGPIATILTPVPFYAGNIRLLNPKIKTLFAETPKAEQRLKRPLVVLWGGQQQFAQQAQFETELLPILQKAGIDTKKLPEVHTIDLPYRQPRTKPQQTEQLYYLYLPEEDN